MKSAVAISYELEDGKETANQLAGSILENLKFCKNSIWFLFCDADTDVAMVTGELKNILGIDIAGMTTLAAIAPDGSHEAVAVLIVLTADDCVFLPAVSESLAHGDHEEKIGDAYRKIVQAGAERDQKPAVMFIFCPPGVSFSGDVYANVLAEVADGVPLIGGVSSDDYDYKRARVCFTGREYRDSMVAVGICGRVKPAFALRHVTSRFAERKRRVVLADGNIVYKIGDETFIKYLEGFGLKTDVDDPLLAFTSYPMMLTREGDDETPLMRHIANLNHSDGSGSFLGDVPTGTLANICLISKDDIKTACRESMNLLLERAASEEDYEYSTIFCISCCGRAMILGSESDAEGRILSEMLPETIAISGAYCLGEICPTRYVDGAVSNRFHNCSIAFCML